jgi:hypothetical protein
VSGEVLVWGAGLVVVAVGYVLKRRDQLSARGVALGLVLAILGFLLPLVLNQLIKSDFLHRLHKPLAFVVAFVVFMAWITSLRCRTHRRSSTT